MNADGTGIIHTIKPRYNYLSRKAPKIKGASYRGERLEQVIAANIDNFFIISSVTRPEFNNKVIDRFLVIGESSNLKLNIVINKIDLDEDNYIQNWAELYKDIGYNVVLTSVKNDIGINELKQLSKNKKNVFWGHSGVGKSSLLNKMYPNLQLQTGVISNYTNKGTHTTVTSVMLKIDEHTFLIDTPGIREIEPFGIKNEDLGHYFKEFANFINDCKFNTCTHNHEPGCAIIKAVENEKISIERYESYLKLLETIEEDILF